MNILKEFKKSNKICPFCNDFVYINDIENNQFVYTETRGNHKRIFAHRKCFERRLK